MLRYLLNTAAFNFLVLNVPCSKNMKKGYLMLQHDLPVLVR